MTQRKAAASQRSRGFLASCALGDIIVPAEGAPRPRREINEKAARYRNENNDARNRQRDSDRMLQHLLRAERRREISARRRRGRQHGAAPAETGRNRLEGYTRHIRDAQAHRPPARHNLDGAHDMPEHEPRHIRRRGAHLRARRGHSSYRRHGAQAARR